MAGHCVVCRRCGASLREISHRWRSVHAIHQLFQPEDRQADCGCDADVCLTQPLFAEVQGALALHAFPMVPTPLGLHARRGAQQRACLCRTRSGLRAKGAPASCVAATRHAALCSDVCSSCATDVQGYVDRSASSQDASALLQTACSPNLSGRCGGSGGTREVACC
jgi:hypothetical protein